MNILKIKKNIVFLLLSLILGAVVVNIEKTGVLNSMDESIAGYETKLFESIKAKRNFNIPAQKQFEYFNLNTYKLALNTKGQVKLIIFLSVLMAFVFILYERFWAGMITLCLIFEYLAITFLWCGVDGMWSFGKQGIYYADKVWINIFPGLLAFIFIYAGLFFASKRMYFLIIAKRKNGIYPLNSFQRFCYIFKGVFLKVVKFITSDFKKKIVLKKALINNIACLEQDMVVLGQNLICAGMPLIDVLALDKQGNLVLIKLELQNNASDLAEVVDTYHWVCANIILLREKYAEFRINPKCVPRMILLVSRFQLWRKQFFYLLENVPVSLYEYIWVDFNRMRRLVFKKLDIHHKADTTIEVLPPTTAMPQQDEWGEVELTQEELTALIDSS
ncbi:MAG: hypothetical protein DRP78_06910 [Candidatus Omnitrophota bacterium]|nr:MAG: hypothetical protein DRP78_06910 [Candidatus Omnitrophota bacterium]